MNANVMVARSVRDCRGVSTRRNVGRDLCPQPSKRIPSNSCLLYLSSIDYINRPVGRLAAPV
jgi:hypothetical protein